MWQEQGEPREAAWRPGREAGLPDHEELADSLAFILRAVGRSWKPERTQSDPSGCRREGAREAGLSVRTRWSRQGEGALGPGTEQGWISAPITPHPQQSSLV